MHHATHSLNSRSFRQHLQHLRLAVAHVNYEGESGGCRKLKMSVKPLELPVKRGEVPVFVQTGFAQGKDSIL